MAQSIPRHEVKVPGIGMMRPAGGGPRRFAPGEKPKNAKGTLMRIVKIYMQWAKTIFLAMLLTAVSSLISVAIPYFVGKTFNTFEIAERTVDTEMLIRYLLTIAALYITNCFILSLNGVIMLKVFIK